MPAKPSAKLRKRLYDSFVVGVCLAPSTVIILVFTYIAFIFCVYLSFNNWNMLKPMQWVGLENYITAFTSPEFYESLKVTFIYVLVAVPACVIIGLLIGLLLDWITFAKSLFRLLLFLPVIISMVVAAVVWRWIFDPNVGIVNQVLYSMGFKSSHWNLWWQDPAGGAMVSVLVVGIWKRVGYNGVLFLGGLKNISDTYYEAATLDGATAWQKFTKITLPLLSPTTFMVTVMQFFAAFKVIESVLVMMRASPARQSMQVLVLYIYENAFSYLKMGYASAISVVLFGLIMFFTIIQLVLEKRMVYYQ
ncbi:carbohydrate ABC transporter permease [Breznakiella homolactica]|uniref:Sugar ABC transporter permease n=1 Tax=Breznakiella homolactica TaxID=2798577 RepID=A0A7T8BBC9_9SPIR|nr:sugar ABC transporter permease [Breznakiella homolactica]QQO09905.1 sugar ABC transporter permease [Breznakiella homolactica]